MLTTLDPNINGRNADIYHEFRSTEESFPDFKKVITLDFAHLHFLLTPYCVARDDFPAVKILYITFVQVMTTFCLGTNLQFPMVSLDFFIDIILSAALWPWG
jgi:hypothetical protein